VKGKEPAKKGKKVESDSSSDESSDDDKKKKAAKAKAAVKGKEPAKKGKKVESDSSSDESSDDDKKKKAEKAKAAVKGKEPAKKGKKVESDSESEESSDADKKKKAAKAKAAVKGKEPAKKGKKVESESDSEESSDDKKKKAAAKAKAAAKVEEPAKKGKKVESESESDSDSSVDLARLAMLKAAAKKGSKKVESESEESSEEKPKVVAKAKRKVKDLAKLAKKVESESEEGSDDDKKASKAKPAASKGTVTQKEVKEPEKADDAAEAGSKSKKSAKQKDKEEAKAEGEAKEVSPEELAEMIDEDGKHKEYKVGKVVSAEPVKKKKGFLLVEVSLGDDSVPVVTTYPNVEENQKVILAPEGSKCAGKPVKRAKLQGEWSAGVICGPAEMGWSGDKSVCIVLDDSFVVGEAAPGHAPGAETSKKAQKAGQAEDSQAKKKEKADEGGKAEAKATKPGSKHDEYKVAAVVIAHPVKKRKGLWWVELDIGEEEYVSCETHYSNIEAARDAGKRVILAPEGATVQGKKVTRQKAAGGESHGVICGPAEMGWAGDASHCVELDESLALGSAAPATPRGAGYVAPEADAGKAAKAAADAEANAPKEKTGRSAKAKAASKKEEPRGREKDKGGEDDEVPEGRHGAAAARKEAEAEVEMDPDAKHPEFKVGEVMSQEAIKKKKGFWHVEVSIGGENIAAVTSYPNVEVGCRVIFAPEGSSVSGKEVKRQKVQGEWASGVVCGPMELGWPGDASLCVLLDPSLQPGEAAPGGPRCTGVLAGDADDGDAAPRAEEARDKEEESDDDDEDAKARGKDKGAKKAAAPKATGKKGKSKKEEDEEPAKAKSDDDSDWDDDKKKRGKKGKRK